MSIEEEKKSKIRREPRRKAPRKRREATPSPPQDPKLLLKQKLAEKLRVKKLERTAKFIRDNRLDVLEERLEKATTPQEKKKIETEIDLLEDIAERENNFCGEFPDYGDGAGYGGSLEHPE